MKTVVGVPGALRKFGERLTPGVVFADVIYMAAQSEIYAAAKAEVRARALMPNVEIIVVEGAGHGLPLTHAERTWTDVLDFVDRHDTIADAP